MSKGRRRFIGVLLVGLLVLTALVGCGRGGTQQDQQQRIVVGGKTYSEQFLLAEIVGQLIEANTDLNVEVKTGLGTLVLFEAMRANEVDVCIEYTGTGLLAILGMDLVTDPDEVYEIVAREYDQQFNITWLEPWGFNNSYSMVMRRDRAEELGLQTVSDLAAVADQLTLGSTPEFYEREDGVPGLLEHYNFQFGDVTVMDPSLMYQAVSQGSVDVISGFTTEGRIPAFDLVVLEDDQLFFPPYQAAPIVRNDVLAEHPELEEVLNLLAGRLNDEKMAALNAEVDVEKRDPDEVAREFLQREGLI